MEKSHSLLPEKSGSFSGREEKRVHETTRNLSMSAAIKSRVHFGKNEREEDKDHPPRIEESKEEEEEEELKEDEEEDNGKPADEPLRDLSVISEEIDRFLDNVQGIIDRQNQIENCSENLPEIPESDIDQLAALVAKEIAKCDIGDDRLHALSLEGHDDLSLLGAVDRVSKLTTALGAFPSDPGYGLVMNRTGAILQRAMSFLEEELRTLLEESGTTQFNGSNRQVQAASSSPTNEPEQPESETPGAKDSPPPYTPEIVTRLHWIVSTMISAGYETECCQMFSIARRNALEAGLSRLGFDKISIDDVQKMSWESLEGEIATWIKAFRYSISISFPQERDLCEAVFSGHPAVSGSLFSNLARGIAIQLLNFAEAVAMTKRSAEKLFKFLDMYEALRDSLPEMDVFFPTGNEEEEDSWSALSPQAELKMEITNAWCRLGEAAIGIFSDLESSIKTDMGRTPVPGGAVHPLTRYVMNYLKYACEYKKTLEQVFQDHQKSERPSDEYNDGVDENHHHLNNNKNHHHNNNYHGDTIHHSPFAAQLVVVMDLLGSNLESKSKLYKDLSLNYIFLMNNGRYIVQKIRGSAEINELLGDTWCRKRSSDLRQYHNNYKRETWSKVLACFKDEGLHVKGSVSKPVLKERFKSFNAMFEEIHKTQSGWIVSDEQLQSELRVSVSAVVVPAYRSFLGRFQQYLDSGRQTEKYIKFGPDDLETYIDELFDGNPSSMVRRRT